MTHAGAAATLWLVCLGALVIFGVATFVFWIVMLIDCFQRANDEFPNPTENTKTIWVIVLLLSWLVWLYWLAAILYLLLVKRRAPRGIRAH